MLAEVLARMYIIVNVTAALGGPATPTLCVNLAITASTTISPPTKEPFPSPRLSITSRVCMSTQLQFCPQTTPHRPCFDALAQVLRIRASYHCRGLRAPLYTSPTGQDNLPLALDLCCFWNLHSEPVWIDPLHAAIAGYRYSLLAVSRGAQLIATTWAAPSEATRSSLSAQIPGAYYLPASCRLHLPIRS